MFYFIGNKFQKKTSFFLQKQSLFSKKKPFSGYSTPSFP